MVTFDNVKENILGHVIGLDAGGDILGPFCLIIYVGYRIFEKFVLNGGSKE